VTLARIVRVRGNRGEVIAEDLIGREDGFSPASRIFLEDPRGRRREATLEEAWKQRDRWVLKLAGVDSISAAEELRNWKVRILEEELGPPPEGEHYLHDLVGCRVLDAETGREIGVVEGVLEPGGSLLLDVRGERGEILIPFVSEICREVSEERREIRVRLPEGLEELNS
jgi:16S rRNA processing protein RimM